MIRSTQTIRSILKAFEKPFLCSDTNPVEIRENSLFPFAFTFFGRCRLLRVSSSRRWCSPMTRRKEKYELKCSCKCTRDYYILMWLTFWVLQCGESTAAAAAHFSFGTFSSGLLPFVLDHTADMYAYVERRAWSDAEESAHGKRYRRRRSYRHCSQSTTTQS